MDVLRRFSGKRVLITGGASGIGKALARLFAGSGARLVLFDLDKGALEDTARELAEIGGEPVATMVVDVADYDTFEEAVGLVVEKTGPVDIFINNAGIGVSGEIVENSVEEIDHITAVNYLGMVYGSRIILPYYYAQGHGHLVNVASVAGLQGFPKMSLYCGAKFGIIGFSQAIRFEMERKGIHLSLVLPSTTDTPMITDKLGPQEGSDPAPGILLAIPMCRVEDVARAAIAGIAKKKFMIFPTMTDRGTLFARSFMPGLFNLFIRGVGFRTFEKKRRGLMEKYGKSK